MIPPPSFSFYPGLPLSLTQLPKRLQKPLQRSPTGLGRAEQLLPLPNAHLPAHCLEPRPCDLPGVVGCAALEHRAWYPHQIKGLLSASSAQAQPLCNSDLCPIETVTGMSRCAYLMGPQGLQIIPGAVFSVSLWTLLCHATVHALPLLGHVLIFLPAVQHLLGTSCVPSPVLGAGDINKTKSLPRGIHSLMGRGADT